MHVAEVENAMPIVAIKCSRVRRPSGFLAASATPAASISLPSKHMPQLVQQLLLQCARKLVMSPMKEEYFASAAFNNSSVFLFRIHFDALTPAPSVFI